MKERTKVSAKTIIVIYLERNKGKVIHYHNLESDLKKIESEFEDVCYNMQTYSRAFRDLKEQGGEVNYGGKKFMLEEVRGEKNYKGWKILEVTKADTNGQFILL